MVAQSIGNALNFVAQNYEKVDFSYNTLQAWCTQKADENPKFNASVFRYYALTIIADVGSLIATSCMLMGNLENKVKWIRNYKHSFFIHAGLGAVIVSTAILGVYLINRYYKPAIPLGQDIQNFSINRPYYEKARQVILVIRIISNIALAVLNPYNPFFVLNAALEIFTLAKITQRKWVEFKKEFDLIIQGNFQQLLTNKMRVTYHFLIQDVKVKGLAKNEEDSCSVCLDSPEEEELLKDVYSCPEHTTHAKCLLDTLGSKSKDFHQGMHLKGRRETETRHYTNHCYTHSTYDVKYDLDVPKTNLPSCPSCRDISDHNSFAVEFYDVKRNKWADGVIAWQN
jgi:hypothetical protein